MTTFVPRNWRPATDRECIERDDLQVDAKGNLYVEFRPPVPLEYAVSEMSLHHETETYVSSPPALWVDHEGIRWVLGMQRPEYADHLPKGEFGFDVLRNGVPTGEYASRIECRNGKVRIFTWAGWKYWSGQSFI